MKRAAIVAAMLALAACRGRGEPIDPPWNGLALDLTPDPARGEVAVRVRVSAEHAARVRDLRVARAWADTHGADAIGAIEVRDAAGTLPVGARSEQDGADLILSLGRAAQGEIEISYRARANVGRSRFGLRLGADRMSGVGHAFLLLPRLDEAVPARVRIHTGALGRGADAASSLGFGEVVSRAATSEDLAHAVYVAGKLWREEAAQGAADQAGKSLVVLGDPPFDTRRAFEKSVAAADAVDRFFGGAPEPVTFFLVAQPGLGRAHDGAWLGRSLGAFVDAAQALDGALLFVLAHELTHRYLGGTLRFTDERGREATWFSEGFTVHFARRALVEAALVTPADLAAEITRITSPKRGAGGDEIDGEYRRGAIAAAYLDREIRRASAGKRSLDDVVRDLLAKARAGGGASLPLAALGEALAREVGAEKAAFVDRAARMTDGEIGEALGEDAFGPCVRRRVTEETVFDLGFDPESVSPKPTFIRGLVRGSAADRAGVTEGALVIAAKVPSREDARIKGAEVDLSLGNGKRVRYRPTRVAREAAWVPSDAASCPLRSASR